MKFLYTIALCCGLSAAVSAQTPTATATATVKLIAPDTITSHRGLTLAFRNGTLRGLYFGKGERIYFVAESDKASCQDFNLAEGEELAAQLFFCDGTTSTVDVRSNETDLSALVFSLRRGDMLVLELRPKRDATAGR